jgi:DNA-binding transcriptional LysR family regulator
MNEQLPDWDDLRLVLAVARAGSLVGAARSLGISHPTVFRRVNRIEGRLGVRLFERARDGYALTAAGEELTTLAGRMDGEIAALERRLAGRDLRPAGSVRVTTTDTLLLGLLTPLFAAFRRRHPEITLEVAAANSFFNLSRREADVAIRPSRDPPDPLVGRKIADIATAVYRPRRSPELADDDLARRDWVIPDDSLSHLPIARWLADRRLEGRAVYRANSLVALLDAARNGLGLVVLPCYVGDREPAVARVGAPREELRSELWLLTHPDLRRVARIRAFLDAMAELLQPLRPLFEGRPVAGPRRARAAALPPNLVLRRAGSRAP